MTIDWFTFTAQILNFLLLVWLLKRFLYGPIINAMEQREARIAARLTSAQGAKVEATALQDEYHKKIADLATTREEIMAAAGQEVDSWRKNHLTTAKAAVETAREQWQHSLVREKQTLLRQLQLDVMQHATDLSRHVLEQLADERLQSRLVERLVTLLASDTTESLQFREFIGKERSILVESSHELNEPDRKKIAAAIAEMASLEVGPDFRVNPQLVCGIELRVPSCKLAWSIRDSLAELKSDLVNSIDDVIPTQPHDPKSVQEELATS